MATSTASPEARAYLAAIGKKGGKVKSKAKAERRGEVRAKSVKSLTPKKLAAIRAMTAARVAKQLALKANGK